LLREVFFERGAIVRFVADEPAWRFVREPCIEGLLDETYFVTLSRLGRCDQVEFGRSDPAVWCIPISRT
jgi:hypothetical protein